MNKGFQRNKKLRKCESTCTEWKNTLKSLPKTELPIFVDLLQEPLVKKQKLFQNDPF